MAAISPDVVEPVLLFCDTFSHPENEVRSYNACGDVKKVKSYILFV